MPLYRVKPGALLPHAGTVYEAGFVLSLPRTVGAELPHLIEEVDEAGQVQPAPEPWALEAERYRQHERVGILQRAKAAALATVPDADAMATRDRDTANASAAAVQRIRTTVAQIDVAIAEAERIALEGESLKVEPKAPVLAPVSMPVDPLPTIAPKPEKKTESSS